MSVSNEYASIRDGSAVYIGINLLAVANLFWVLHYLRSAAPIRGRSPILRFAFLFYF